MVWVFVNPLLYGPGYWLSTAGIVVTGASLLATIWYAGLASIWRPGTARRSGWSPIAH